jgi:hypothetical protein
MKLSLVPGVLIITLWSVFPFVTEASNIDPELEACIRKNAPQSTAIQNIRLSSMDDMFEEKVLEATVYWKQLPDGNSDLLAVFDEPSDISGSRLLFLEKKPDKEIYLYMPALLKVRRITSSRVSSSMYGMDFSYEDFQWLYNMLATATSEQRPDVILDGEPVYVLAVVPVEASGSKYEEVVSYFEKKSCVIRKVEFYEGDRKLRKILSAAPGGVKQVNGMFIPHVFQMKDLKKKSETDLVITSVRLDTVIPDSIFDPAQLKKPHGIE